MAKDNEDFTSANAHIIQRWTRDKERAELSAEHAEKQTRKAIANLLKEDTNRKNIARDLKRATDNPKQFKTEGGFGAKEFDDGSIITGLEERPWDRDIDD